MHKFTFFVGLVLCLATSQAAAQPYTMTLAGASPGGLWSLIGAGVDEAVREQYPGSTITYQTSGGGYANVKLLQDSVVELALVHDAEAKQAMQGAAPFEAAVTSIRALAVMYDFSVLQPLISAEFAEEYGIKSFADLRDKKPPIRITVNKRGNITHDLAVNVLKASGITLEDIESWGGQVHIAASRDAAEMMRNRQVDMTMNAPFVRHSSILEVANAMPVTLLRISDDAVAQVREEMGIGQLVIPAATYEWLDEDMTSLALAAMIVVRDDMPVETASAITAALVENISAIQGVHKAMQALTPQMMTSQSAVPFHPGAEAVYREAGLLN